MRILLAILITAYLVVAIVGFAVIMATRNGKVTFKTEQYPLLVRWFFNLIGIVILILIFPIALLKHKLTHK